MANDLDDLQDCQQEFIQTRNWEQFHTPKSIAMAISVEASELVECFQWHDNLPVEAYHEDAELESAVEEELADILIYTLSMASEFDIDLEKAVAHKLEQNKERFDSDTSSTIREELIKYKRDHNSAD